MKILCIQGSLGTPAHTATLLGAVISLLGKRDVRPDVLDLRQEVLPFADPSYHHKPHENPDPAVRRLVERATAAEGFVLASPVYHNSYSGVLKNCLDHLHINHFADKPVALCGNGGGNGSVQPVDHLRIVIRGLHGVAIPYNIVSRNTDYEPADGQFRIVNGDLVKRLRLMVDQLISYTEAFIRIRAPQPELAPAGVSGNSSAR